MKVFGAPMGVDTLWGPQGMHLGKGDPQGLIFRVFWGMWGDKKAMW